MPYKISEFDGLSLPEFLARGDTQSMGTGVAVADFVRMPGGGFWDNYGDSVSPRELDAITKRCALYAGATSVRVQVEALRAKLGVRGVLEVLWHDGEVRWQYARLTRVHYPRPFDARLTHIPVDLTFMPAAGTWYDEDVTVDVTTFAGSSFAETVVVANAGNADVVDAQIEYESPVAAALELTLNNRTTSQIITLTVAGVAIGDILVVDIGKRTARVHRAPTAINTVTRTGNVITVNTTPTAHGLSVADEVTVIGTADYDGFYTVATVPDTETITVAADPAVRQPYGPESPAAATLAEVNNLYGDADFSDAANWMALAPGNNSIYVTADQDLDGGVLTFTFYPTYA
jgi:hypothetical protein